MKAAMIICGLISLCLIVASLVLQLSGRDWIGLLCGGLALGAISIISDFIHDH